MPPHTLLIDVANHRINNDYCFNDHLFVYVQINYPKTQLCARSLNGSGGSSIITSTFREAACWLACLLASLYQQKNLAATAVVKLLFLLQTVSSISKGATINLLSF